MKPCARWWPAKRAEPFPNIRQDRWSTCIHEAAHFVAGAHFNVDQAGAEVAPKDGALDLPDKAGLPVLGRVALRDRKSSPDVRVPREVEEEVALELVTYFLAGYQGELIAAGITPTSFVWANTHDHRMAVDLLFHVFDHDLQLRYCQEWARRILLVQWPSVLRIARELERCGSVAGLRLLALHAAGLADGLPQTLQDALAEFGTTTIPSSEDLAT